jgi:hypothetical protein
MTYVVTTGGNTPTVMDVNMADSSGRRNTSMMEVLRDGNW